MTGYDSVAVIDWNAGNDTGPTPKKDAIWAGAVLGGTAVPSVYLRNRDLALIWMTDLISTEIAAGRRLIIGVDFPLGYPRGFGAAIVGAAAPLKLWDFFATALRDTPQGNNRFALAGALNARFPGVGPFWFNALKADIAHLPRLKSDRTPDHGQAEKRRCEARLKGAFTVWQMGGAGSVGGQVMTGMATLSKVMARFPGQIAVWPFTTAPAPVLIVEIWPGLINDAVRAARDTIRDRAQVRLLSQSLAALPLQLFHRMLSVDEPDEGWILGTGYHQELTGYAWPS